MSVVREIEVKSVVDDVDAIRSAAERAGAKLTFRGRLEDRRYDDAQRSLTRRDRVLRVRTYRNENSVMVSLDFKGPTETTGGENPYKLREEQSTGVEDGAVLATVLTQLGFQVTREIDRDIEQYDLGGVMVRFERYPRMDVLVEVEGEPDAIEAAIAALGMSRAGFSAGRLDEFVRKFEARTGVRSAISERELKGDYSLSRES